MIKRVDTALKKGTHSTPPLNERQKYKHIDKVMKNRARTQSGKCALGAFLSRLQLACLEAFARAKRNSPVTAKYTCPVVCSK